MASIRKRIASGCITETVQVQIRRAGIPSFTITFASLDEAQQWVSENEQLYIANPSSYDWMRTKPQRRDMRRAREFAKPGN